MRPFVALALFFALLVLGLVGFGLPINAAPTGNSFPSPVPSLGPSAAVQSNPFPSPSPTPPTVGGNGFIAVGYLAGSAGGGVIQPTPGSTATAVAFPSSATESGFWVDMIGRIAPSYLASLTYENYKIAGGDRPFISYAQLRALYQPHNSRWAFGLGILSAQRSTANANVNAFGFGYSLLPSVQSKLTPYSFGFFYPHVQANGSASSLFAGQTGLMFFPRKGGGLFLRLGISTHCCFPSATSPKSDFGTVLGLGTSF